MGDWLEKTEENKMPNIEKLLRNYNDYINWLKENYSSSAIPPLYQGLYDDIALEFARVFNHDLECLSSKVAKYMLLMNDEYEIKIKVE